MPRQSSVRLIVPSLLIATLTMASCSTERSIVSTAEEVIESQRAKVLIKEKTKLLSFKVSQRVEVKRSLSGRNAEVR